MANARGTRYSRWHHKWSPDGKFKHKYWSYSWDQIAQYDLSKIIDKVLEFVRRDPHVLPIYKEKIFIIAHSQGNTTSYALLSTQKHYNEKIKLLISLSPVAFMSNMGSLLIRSIAKGLSLLKVNISSILMRFWVKHICFIYRNFIYSSINLNSCLDEIFSQKPDDFFVRYDFLNSYVAA